MAAVPDSSCQIKSLFVKISRCLIFLHLRRLLAKPEVDIPGLLPSWADLCVQDNIGISNMELSILLSLLIKYRLKILGLKVSEAILK